MLQNLTLTFGKTGKIFCKVESENKTIYEWKLDGRSLQRSDRINIMKDEYLEIHKVNENDAGVYKCIATIISNYVAEPYSVDIKVSVTGGQPVRPTIFTPSIPNAESTIVHRTEPEGHTARTTALFQTRPNAETTWPITHRTEPKGKPGGPSTRLPNTKTIKGIPSGRDDSNPNGGSEGKILFHRKFGNSNISIVMLSIMSMLIITVP
ncbi:uncharacterized protein LOC117103703 [Anneissia japonica]|uniref:uncharacterized protein LOC117103703 n=1 Tax=Anneissia japonica TaxID=1529436 RepID=UPI001425A0C7|nr:uncharacterized protein LOC117103703 [Anneissia japonica]